MRAIGYIINYLCVICIISCNSATEVWNKADNFDFEYKIIRKEHKNPGSEIREGDLITFKYQMSLENAEILENSKDDQPVKITIPAKMYRNQFEEAFLYATSGDSLVVRYKKEKVPNLLQKHKNKISEKDVYIFLSYKILDVLSAYDIREKKDSAFSEKLYFDKKNDYKAEKKRAMESFSSLKKATEEKINLKKSGKLRLQNHNGYKLAIVEEGSGKKAGEGDIVCFYYLAAIEKDAGIFDDNFKNGSRYCFKYNEETKKVNILHPLVKDLQKGTKAYIFVPAESGYGKTGSPPVVPPDTDLVFYIEIAELIPQK